jgi:hypothetical protein
MSDNSLVRVPRLRGRVLVAVLAAVAVMVPMAFAAPALAVEPTGEFAVFKQCPRFTAEVELCLYSETLGGHVTLNKQTVPINEDKKHPIILQGGIIFNEETKEQKFVGALNGETLSKTPQNVPGGLLGLINCTEIKGKGIILEALAALARTACKAVFENKTTGVSATTELARPASEIGINTSNLANENGIALSLPVKVHLENPFLGSECYIGSSAQPITFNFTTGTTSPPPPNTPIKGSVGNIQSKDNAELIEITENVLVDNAFSAPAATGCGGIFSVLIDPLINSKIGLPSPAGHNTAIQENTIREATTVAVKHSEK